MDRQVNKKRAILALVLTVIIFSAVFLTSYLVSYNEYRQIAGSQEKALFDILNVNVRQSISGISCQNYSLFDLSLELDGMGGVISVLETRFGKFDARVIEQKEKYSILEAQHFIYTRDYTQNCNQNISTILFFYSNKEEFVYSSERIGYILSNLKAENPEKIMVYSFDYDLDSEAINLLKEKYFVNQPNTLIINEKTKVLQIQSLEQIKKAIENAN